MDGVLRILNFFKRYTKRDDRLAGHWSFRLPQYAPEWLCEAIGTALLVLGGLSAVMAFVGKAPSHEPPALLFVRLAGVGLCFGTVGAVFAYSPLGRLSGAHINPSVTTGFLVTGHIRVLDAVGYVLSQCLGGIGGTWLWKALWGKQVALVHTGVTLPGPSVSALEATAAEVLMTAALMALIGMFLASQKWKSWTPLGVAALVPALVCLGAQISGTSLNFARSIGPDALSGNWNYWWIYLVGPELGALIAGLYLRNRSLHRRIASGKLVHDPRYRSRLQRN